jgi:hypothetical protein
LSFPGARLVVNSSRCRASSWWPSRTGAWCQVAVAGGGAEQAVEAAEDAGVELAEFVAFWAGQGGQVRDPPGGVQVDLVRPAGGERDERGPVPAGRDDPGCAGPLGGEGVVGEVAAGAAAAGADGAGHPRGPRGDEGAGADLAVRAGEGHAGLRSANDVP